MKLIKIITLTLCIIFIFAACVSDNRSNPDRSAIDNSDITEEPEASYWDILGERDFGGATFAIINANQAPDFRIMPEQEYSGEPINDAMFDRDRLVEEKFGVNIEYSVITNGSATLKTQFLAGENTYDLISDIIAGGNLELIATQNILYNLIDAPYLSLSSPWWSRLIRENLTFESKLYFTGGDIFLPSYARAPAVMGYNKKLFVDYNIEENLYNMVFDGTWTIDVFERIIKDKNRDLNADGVIKEEDDFFGVCYSPNTLSSNFIVAGIGMNLSSSANGEIKINLDSQNILDKIDKLAGMLVKSCAGETFKVIFREGRGIFIVTNMSLPILMRDMEDDYGILPMPKWNEQQESYISLLNGFVSGFIAIPGNITDIEKAAFITEAMAYAGYEILRKPIYETTFKIKGARDEESAQIIDIIVESAYLDLNAVYNFGKSLDTLASAVIQDNKKPFLSAYESIKPAVQNAVDNFIEAMSQQ